MTYLLRASSHGNQVSVIDRTDMNMITKTTSHADGILALQKEAEGLKWYANQLSTDVKDMMPYAHMSQKFARIDIQKFKGVQVAYKKPFLQNSDYLENMISHYKQIWPKSERASVHGDLTLDNIIFTNQGARLFDWEHFTTEPHPWGFDALYCLLSGLLLPLEKDQFPTKQDYTQFLNLLFTLMDDGLSAELAEYPLSNIRKILKERECWQTIIKNSPDKLFPLKYDELYIDIIDDQITRRIRHKRYDIFKNQAKNT